MSARWSSEHVVAEYKDLQANCMSVDTHGHYALLGGRRSLAVVDLNHPTDANSMKKLSRTSKWEISAMRWNPHKSHAHQFVTASNQRIELYQWVDGKGSSSTSIKAHTRAISDLDWSTSEPNMLATCSVDTYTFLWDIRDHRRPSVSLQAVSGVSQVKWNRFNNYIATAHDSDIRIWDPRKGNSPVQYIAGHLSKIHGLDWSRDDENILATSSQDCTVKFWDVMKPRKAEKVLSSTAPVWRARFTPFGNGLITVVVPQLRRGENSLLLWNTDSLVEPLHTFVGHNDVVLEFEWREVKLEGHDYQLVTWARDQTLRIWRIDNQLQAMCGHESDEELVNSEEDEQQEDDIEPETSQEAMGTPPQKTMPSRPSHLSPQQPKTLQQEFSLININIPYVKIDEMDAPGRRCTISAVSGKHLVKVNVKFPANYPNKAAPEFQFVAPTNVNSNTKERLAKVLEDTSLQNVRRNRCCLEPCVRQLISSMDIMTMDERRTPDSDTPYNLQQTQIPITKPLYPMQPAIPNIFLSSSYDSSIPFPRTSGARFSPNGCLVVFKRPTAVAKKNSQGPEITPRALSALSAIAQPITPAFQFNFNVSVPVPTLSSPPRDGVSISNFYEIQKERKLTKGRPRRSRNSSDPSAEFNVPYIEKKSSSKKSSSKYRHVIIYDMSCLFPVSKYLAENYVLNSDDLPGTCTKNAKVASNIGRKDLVQMWSLVAIATNKRLKADTNPDSGPPWAYYPMGRKLLKSLMDYYSSIHDIQTLGMLCCIFGANDSSYPPLSHSASSGRLSVEQEKDYYESGRSSRNLLRKYSPYHTIQANDTAMRDYLLTGVTLRRSNSWSTADSYDDYHFEEKIDLQQVAKERHENNIRMLEPSKQHLYDVYKYAYAELLYIWGLLNKRAEVLKYVSVPPEPHKGIEFVTICHYCRKEVRGPQCGSCKNYGFQCSICHIAVKGAANFCLACGHGGHSIHMKEWFQNHSVCPTGCGCNCLKDNPMAS